jgi:Concanavalin A-like lectin/glucanases superfamily
MVAVMLLELVLRHDYTTGGVADDSGYGNHGHPFGDSAFGPEGLAFDGRRTRVTVPPSPSLTALSGIRVSARFRLDEFGERRTIIEGYLAFAVVVEEDGALQAGVYTAERWEGAASAPGVLPLGRWVQVTFLYDGQDTVMLWLNRVTIATRLLPMGPLGGVAWPYGVSIGAWPDQDLRMFSGAISRVELWRPVPGLNLAQPDASSG